MLELCTKAKITAFSERALQLRLERHASALSPGSMMHAVLGVLRVCMCLSL